MVYIIWRDEVLQMAVNDSVTVSKNSDITKYKTEFGSDTTDNLVNQNNTYKITGMVSNITSFVITKDESEEESTNISGSVKPNQKYITEYFSLLERIRQSKEVVSLFFDSQVDNGGVGDCIIKSVEYTRSSRVGNAYMVNMTVEQIRRSKAVKFTQRREMDDPDQTQEEVRGGVKTTQEKTEPTQSSGAVIVGGIFGG